MVPIGRHSVSICSMVPIGFPDGHHWLGSVRRHIPAPDSIPQFGGPQGQSIRMETNGNQHSRHLLVTWKVRVWGLRGLRLHFE